MWQPIVDQQRIAKALASFPAWLEVDLDRLRFNLAQLRQRVGVEIMPVVKNNAYGHGLVPVTQCLYDEGVRWFLVAKLNEAVVIRRRFGEARVLCMDALFGDASYERVVRHGITQAVFTLDMARKLSETARRNGLEASVFIKVDTGLRRVGVHFEQAAQFAQTVAELPNLAIAGLFSSFMQHPDEDRNMLARFNAVVDEVTSRGIEVPIRTMASTNAIFHMPSAWLDMVRPAMCLFGVHPFPQDREVDLPLEQVIALKARIEFEKAVEAGDTVTYFGTFTAKRPMRVGTLHIGFYDAIPRELVNKLRITVGDVIKPGVGTIALNHSLLDLSGTDARIGDEVTIIGRQGENSLYEFASAAGWMVYSVMNHFNVGLPRVFFEDGKAVALLDPAGVYDD